MHTHLLNATTSGPTVVAGFAISPVGLLLALFLALCTPLVLAVARRRVVAQPLEAHLDEERRVVAHVLAAPGTYVYVHQLRPEHFVDTALGEIWSIIVAESGGVEIPETPPDARRAYAILEALEHAVPADLAERVTARLGDDDHATTLAVLRSLHSDRDADHRGTTTREDLVAIAGKVYNAGVDRDEYAGSARIERTGDPDRPLRRIASRTSPLRTAIAVILLALGGYVAERIAEGEATGGAQVAIAVAVCLLTVGSVIWTLVDLETMYVDMASFAVLAGTSWAAVLVAALLQGTLGRAVTGLLVVGGIVGFIEVVNQFYRRVRGRDGMGMGDYLLVLATIGVPVGVTGSLFLGQVVLIVSLLAGIVGWVFTRMTRPGFTRETPYAFGPYLACGWILGVVLWMAGS